MAMNFAAARKRVGRLLAPKRPQDLSRSALTADPLRDNVIDESIAMSPRFQRALKAKPEVAYENADGELTKFEWDTFGEAVLDTARAMYGMDEPEVRSREQVKPSHRLNREVTASILGSEAFREQRPYTRNRQLEAMVGAQAISDSLEESAKTTLAEHVARSEEMGEAEEGMAEAGDAMERLKQQAAAENAADGTVSDATRREIKQAMKQAQASEQKLGELVQAQNASSLVIDSHAAAQAAAGAASDAVDEAAALGMLPGMGAGPGQDLPPEQALALMEKWGANSDLRELLRMVGRMIRDMRFKREARTKNVPVEPVSITTGRSIERMLPHEMARAYIDVTKPMWIDDYSGRKLLEYQMQGKTPAGKGPLVFCIDGSGSMGAEAAGVKRFVWASSLVLAGLTIAQREKRDFACVEFGSAGQLKSWVFPGREQADPDMVLEMCTHFFAGGTSTVTGMRESLRIIKDVPAFKTADVVLVSDGQDSFGSEDKAIRDELTELNVRVHGVSIATPGNVYCEAMCDYVVDVVDLAHSNEATDKLAQNIT